MSSFCRKESEVEGGKAPLWKASHAFLKNIEGLLWAFNLFDNHVAASTSINLFVASFHLEFVPIFWWVLTDLMDFGYNTFYLCCFVVSLRP